MCILIVKPRGAEFPTLGAIENSAASNPDGFGLAYNFGGEVKTYRTTSAARFIAKYARLSASLDPENTAMIIHARIATHGAVRLCNCHCWKSFAGTPEELSFAHNGILSTPARDGLTDSETFLRDYFEPAYIHGGWGAAREIIRRKIGTSKFAFIDRAGDVRTFGSFIGEGGCLYSNRSYEHPTYARWADPRNWGSHKAI